LAVLAHLMKAVNQLTRSGFLKVVRGGRSAGVGCLAGSGGLPPRTGKRHHFALRTGAFGKRDSLDQDIEGLAGLPARFVASTEVMIGALKVQAGG
jgi:hypothetical protein